MPSGLRVLVLAAALGCGTLGGVLFAFSGFVMPALRRLPDVHGVLAMQSINVTAVRFPLMSVMFATAAACVALVVVAIRRWGEPGSGLLLAGTVLFLVGGILVTGALNVPLNDELAAFDPSSAVADGSWSHFLDRWTPANHVRTAACLAASACLMGAAVRA